MKYLDRIKETTTTTGTGAVTLDGAVSGFRAFSGNYADNESLPYEIQGGSEWEIGIGHTSSGTLVRDTVIASSNSNSLVSFSSGTKFVFVSLPGRNVADVGVTVALRGGFCGR